MQRKKNMLEFHAYCHSMDFFQQMQSVYKKRASISSCYVKIHVEPEGQVVYFPVCTSSLVIKIL